MWDLRVRRGGQTRVGPREIHCLSGGSDGVVGRGLMGGNALEGAGVQRVIVDSWSHHCRILRRFRTH